MQTIKFNRNWNGKLACDIFTTIRIHSPYKYKVGEIYKQETHIRKDCEASSLVQCLHISTYNLEDIPNPIFYTDCGMNKVDAIKMMETMYSKYNINIHKEKWDMVVLKHYFSK